MFKNKKQTSDDVKIIYLSEVDRLGPHSGITGLSRLPWGDYQEKRTDPWPLSHSFTELAETGNQKSS